MNYQRFNIEIFNRDLPKDLSPLPLNATPIEIEKKFLELKIYNDKKEFENKSHIELVEHIKLLRQENIMRDRKIMDLKRHITLKEACLKHVGIDKYKYAEFVESLKHKTSWEIKTGKTLEEKKKEEIEEKYSFEYSKNYIRLATYSFEEVLPYVVCGEGKRSLPLFRDYSGISVRMNSKRLKLFVLKGVKCVTCGIEGKFFSLDKFLNTRDNIHLNLYGVNENGKDILMTRDHIIPLSKGGSNNMKNSQTMCVVCNCKKGSN